VKDVKLLLAYLFQVMLKQTFVESRSEAGKYKGADPCLI